MNRLLLVLGLGIGVSGCITSGTAPKPVNVTGAWVASYGSCTYGADLTETTDSLYGVWSYDCGATEVGALAGRVSGDSVWWSFDGLTYNGAPAFFYGDKASNTLLVGTIGGTRFSFTPAPQLVITAVPLSNGCVGFSPDTAVGLPDQLVQWQNPTNDTVHFVQQFESTLVFFSMLPQTSSTPERLGSSVTETQAYGTACPNGGPVGVVDIAPYGSQ